MRRPVAVGAALTALALAAAGCGAPAARPVLSAPPVPVAVERVSLAPLPNGTVYLGTITPYVETNISPAISGVLASVNVRPGDRVTAGEVLATLNDSLLTPQLAQAEANLQKATEPPTPATVAVSQDAVAKAEAALQGAEQQLADAKALYNDRTQAEAQLVSAQNQVAQAKANLTAAQVNLQKAQLQEQAALNGGGTPQDLASLQQIVQADQQQVQAAQQALQVAANNKQVADQTLATAENSYGTITAQEVEQAYQNYLSELAAFDSWQQEHGSPAGPTNDNPYQNAVNADQSIYQGLYTGYQALQQAQQQDDQAQTAYAQAQTALANAQSALAQAQKNLADAEPSGNTNAAQQAQLTVAAAQAALEQAQAQYQGAEASLKVAEAEYNDRLQAQQSLDAAENAVQQDQAALQQAEASYQQTVQPPDPATVAAARAGVELVQAQIQDGNILSPITGVVQQVTAQVGQAVGPSAGFITIAATSPVMATVNVPAFDIGHVHVGQAMAVTLPALGVTAMGHVLDIQPELSASTDAYPVDVVLDRPPQGVLPGMQVEAQAAGQSGEKAIMVPADAVLSLQGGAYEVFLDQNGVAKNVIVQVGLMTTTEYQITQGLKVGELLVVQGQNLLSPGDHLEVVSGPGARPPSAAPFSRAPGKRTT
ncbi:MAG: efflux RND transporter periplasmic adaptor subunit [Firmicutes bacterium]|nr:efflux RND transporter periplasmic adaptor subunit [Alicyclobacillaceae bacterium]MCL6497045.1 efflux RND transporter periplasmic adaptor subunit [Bacillota bacterium]